MLNNAVADRRSARREPSQNVLRTLAIKYHETLLRLPRLKSEVDGQLTQYVGSGADFYALARALAPILARAQAFLLAVDLVAAEYPNQPGLEILGLRYATMMTAQTVIPLAEKFDQRCEQSLMDGGSSGFGNSSLPDSVAPVAALAVPQRSDPVSLSRAGFIDNNDGTLSDPKTGLMWKRTAEGQQGNQGEGVVLAFRWHNAVLVPGVLNRHDGLGGHTDWRLPTVKELETLVCMNQVPAINLDAFPGTPGVAFWTSTEFNIYDAWTVNFKQGASKCNSRLEKLAVRLVRSL